MSDDPTRQQTAGGSAASRRFVIAGGGTGGHVTPALALGETLRDAGDRVLFVGARRGMETRLVPGAGFELVALEALPLVGQSPLARLHALLALVGSTRIARRTLKEFQAELVISVGGYAAVPVILAARLTRTPLVMVEPNALPGFAHRAFARFASRICLAFPEAASRLGHGAGDPRIRETGIPLRSALVATFRDAGPPRDPRPPIRVFVFGGSQGSRQINDWMLEILPQLDPGRVRIVHQTGADDRERVASAYAATALDAEVIAFESDMPSRYAQADLVVSRAGALTVAELALAGRPAVLIPLVHAGGGEQLPNARSLEAVGAARLLDPRNATPKQLAESLEELTTRPEQLRRMGERAASLARPDAAARVIDECRALLAAARPAEIGES